MERGSSGLQETLQTAEAWRTHYDREIHANWRICSFVCQCTSSQIRPLICVQSNLRSTRTSISAASMPDWDTRIQASGLLIAERVLEASKSRELGSAWQRLVTTDGRAAIGTLAEELECSRRVLIEKFRMQIGIVPDRCTDIPDSITRYV
ncbi:MAG: hypothetical protein R3C52_12410 [Hyphomonadaceae bacterium]